MKILLLSDTHGNVEGPVDVIRNRGPFDRFFHMGDTFRDAQRIHAETGVPMTAVSGNMDGPRTAPEIEVVGIEGLRFMLVHGDRHSVTRGLTALNYEAESREVDVVCFGHSHRPCDESWNGRRFLNPGAFGQGRVSYGVVTVEGGTVSFELCKQ